MTTIEIHPSAHDVLRAMTRQANAVSRAWSDTPDRTAKMQSSLSGALASIFDTSPGSRPQVDVHRDGDLSLLVTAFITIGVIFFPEHRRVKMAVAGDIDLSCGAVRTGRYCMTGLADEAGRYCMSPYLDNGTDEGERTCDNDHHVALPVTMPLPGEWSLHS